MSKGDACLHAGGHIHGGDDGASSVAISMEASAGLQMSMSARMSAGG